MNFFKQITDELTKTADLMGKDLNKLGADLTELKQVAVTNFKEGRDEQIAIQNKANENQAEIAELEKQLEIARLEAEIARLRDGGAPATPAEPTYRQIATQGAIEGAAGMAAKMAVKSTLRSVFR